MTADKIIKTMQDWVGTDKRKIIDIYNAHKPLARNYKVKYTDAWCDTTVSACFIKNNAVDLIGGTECSVQQHINIFKNKGIWQEDGRIVPRPGDIICYNWDDSTQPNDGIADHIGIVEKVSGNQITVIEGNYNNAVKRRTIPVGWGYVRGYAQPKYEERKNEEIKTATNIVIDVSEHNGQINWQEAKKAIAGVVIRCGYGENIESQDDKYFDYNVKACERYGIPYAFYLYSYAKDTAGAISEANHALRLAKGHTPAVIYFDSEQKGTQAVAKANAEMFITRVRREGYKAGVYASKSWYSSYMKGINSDSLWLAAYGTNNGTAQEKYRPNMGEDLWQYTSVGSIPGSNHKTDMNLMYRNIFGETPKPSEPSTNDMDLLELVAYTWEDKYGKGDERMKALGKRYNEVQAMINYIVKTDTRTLAKDVIAGKFGNGELRKRVLGPRYAEVQKEVNKLLA